MHNVHGADKITPLKIVPSWPTTMTTAPLPKDDKNTIPH
jgi:hypothetical protein